MAKVGSNPRPLAQESDALPMRHGTVKIFESHGYDDPVLDGDLVSEQN